MSARVIDLTRRETAVAERDRADAFLTAVDAMRPLREQWDAFDQDDLSDEAWEVLEKLQEQEGVVLKLALDPELQAFLECIRDQLADIAEGRP
jgi:hypothetical protein